MQPRYLRVIVATALYMVALLLADAPGAATQIGLGLATALFLAMVVRGSGVPAAQVICAIVVATIGEVVLSLGWGLYTYRNALIPLYVPPGHGLFYTLAAYSARQELFRRYERAITTAAVTFGSIVAIVSLIVAHDVWGLVWWCGAVALIARSRNQLLLSACFAFTIVLEWVGTAIGNWRWAGEVPGIGLHSANPPSGVGILYILLDLIVVGLMSLRAARSPDPIASET